ncbi:MAG: fibronectin type III domain-containing protein, partial [Clostridiales bacterium]|nr:fibronectin type III domain-containing protein [Clostridiales bacterium]
ITVQNPYFGERSSLKAPKAIVNTFVEGKLSITIKDKSVDEKGFRIYKTDASGKIVKSIKDIPTSDTTGTNKSFVVQIEGLDPEMTYFHIVKAYNNAGEGEASDVIPVNE